MSLSTPEITLGRIESATPFSQIAVFKTMPKSLRLDAFFADTISGKNYIKENKQILVGIFDNTMNFKNVSLLLNTSIRKKTKTEIKEEQNLKLRYTAARKKAKQIKSLKQAKQYQETKKVKS